MGQIEKQKRISNVEHGMQNAEVKDRIFKILSASFCLTSESMEVNVLNSTFSVRYSIFNLL